VNVVYVFAKQACGAAHNLYAVTLDKTGIAVSSTSRAEEFSDQEFARSLTSKNRYDQKLPFHRGVFLKEPFAHVCELGLK
jgi:hypothetical protein